MPRSNFSGIASYIPKPQKDWCRNEKCLRQVSKKVAEFSMKSFGVVLCYDCQRKPEYELQIDKNERS